MKIHPGFYNGVFTFLRTLGNTEGPRITQILGLIVFNTNIIRKIRIAQKYTTYAYIN